MDAQYPAYDREREVQHDERRIACRAERRHQHEEDRNDDANRQEEQLAEGLRLALELAAVLDVIALWKRDGARDTRLNVVDHASEIAPRHVALDDEAALHILTHHEVRPPIALNSSDRGEGHQGSV